MNKQELTRELAVSENLLLSTATIAIRGLIRIITQELAAGKPVYIGPLGTFKPIDVKARSGYNIHTGEHISVPAHKAARFSAAPELKAILNNTDKSNDNKTHL